MQHGVDLNTLDFFPMGEKSSDQANGIADAVFSFSCASGEHQRSWKNPNEPRDEKTGHHTHYSMPVDFQDVRMVPEGNMDFTVDMSTTVHDLKVSLGVQAGLGGVFKSIGFSASGGYKTIKENMVKNSKSVAIVSA